MAQSIQKQGNGYLAMVMTQHRTSGIHLGCINITCVAFTMSKPLQSCSDVVVTGS